MNNLKIGVRLAIGFAVTLALLIVISTVAVMRINALNVEIEGMVNDKFPKTVQTNNVVDAINAIARHLRNAYIYSGGEQQKSLDSIGEERKIISENIDKLEKTITSDKGKEILGKLRSARAEYVTQQDKFLELLRANKRDEIVVLMQGALRTTQTAYLKVTNDLIDFQTALMTQAGKDADDMANSSERLLMVLAVVAALLAVAMGFFITRSITRPVGAALGVAEKIAAGDFDMKIDTSAKDEVGQVLVALDKAVTSVRTMSAEAARLAQAAVDGKLATRADASKYSGEYRKIVQGVNDTLDAVIGPLNVAAKYVDEISRGAIPAKITDSYNGDFNLIKNNLNTCVDAVNALVADAVMLSKAAVEGKLATRADASRHQGDYRKVVQGVNDTLDAVIGPLNVAAKYVDEISRGAIPAKITDNYNGDFNLIKNNLNTCIDAVNALVSDANMLAKAAVELKLDTRADASRHQGDYRKIVQGVNDTLDAVIGPLKALLVDAGTLSQAVVDGRLDVRGDLTKHRGDFRNVVSGMNEIMEAVNTPVLEIKRVMSALTEGDLTNSINLELKGAFGELKEAINAMIGKLTQVVNDVNTGAHALASASEEVSATAQSLSQAASEQAAGVEETSASIEQMTASICLLYTSTSPRD